MLFNTHISLNEDYVELTVNNLYVGNRISDVRFNFLSHPSLGWLYVFSSLPPHPPQPQQLLPLTSKPFKLHLRYLGQKIYRSGKMYWMTFPWSWPKVTAVASISKHFLVCMIKWEPPIRSLQNVIALKILDVFFQGQTLIWPYLRNGCFDWCGTKRKCIGWILGMICDLDHWPAHDLDIGCFNIKFRNNCISGIVGLIDVWNEKEANWKDTELTIWLLPFDHTHDLDLGVSRSESETVLSQEWDSRLTWNKKDVSHPFITMILTMVGWADVPDSDQGNFRRRHAVHISTSIMISLQTFGMFYFLKLEKYGNIECTSALNFTSLWTVQPQGISYGHN